MDSKSNIPRRHHYVPQYYLKGFTDPESEMIWVNDKLSRKAFQTGTTNAAVETDFYEMKTYSGDDDKATLERDFAEKIEVRCNPSIAKVRGRETLDGNDKSLLALYVLSMIKRVPAGKERLTKIIPKVADRRHKEVLMELDQLGDFITEDSLNQIKSVLSDIIQWNKDNLPAEALLPKSISTVIPILKTMTWIFWEIPDGQYFVTSDNPVFYHRSTGLAKGEFTFPIAKNVALFGSHTQTTEDCTYISAEAKVIKEINRRTVFNATRFVYSSKNHDWISLMLGKPKITIQEQLEF